ncbi:adenosine kinase-like [Macrosteles quadrilineatus]|uniref:adenosine kinase-like n=1 Tax=Macrosteles quadrilineatus TaxID=74068 RepID=UPI0023E178FE|nr:adenosine kinase-like [Macrosteles quadrilineatus]
MHYLNQDLFYKKHVFAGFGNPLVDISALIKSDEILEKFNLKPDGQCEVNEHDISEMLKFLDRENHEVRKSPGGCVQNTLRIVQALVKQPQFCVFFGGLGNDSDGGLLESEVKKCGVETRYTKHPAYSTGKVAALIHGDKRSLVAHLGAAEVYRREDFETSENLKILEEVVIVYIEGFFITHSLDVALEVIKICKSKGVIVAFNISGAYVAEAHSEKLLATVVLADIVIGNDSEFKALGKIINLSCDTLKDLAMETFLFLKKQNIPSHKFKVEGVNDLNKVLVMTRGKAPVYCVFGDGEIMEFAVPTLDVSLIKDTTGAGDSFAAAFLLALIQGKSLTECLAFGCATAHKVIQEVGVYLGDK